MPVLFTLSAQICASFSQDVRMCFNSCLIVWQVLVVLCNAAALTKQFSAPFQLYLVRVLTKDAYSSLIGCLDYQILQPTEWECWQ